MTTFYTSDEHFGHLNIIRYCERPYADVEEMNEALVNNHNAVVLQEDTVYILGDFSLGIKELWYALRLNGRKILVAGNHDHAWEHHKKGRKGGMVEKYLEAGFSEVITSGIVYGHDILGMTVNLSHLPYAGDSHDEDRYEKYRPIDDGRPLVCGHVHEKWKVSGRQVNCGVDQWSYRPVPELELFKELEKL